MAPAPQDAANAGNPGLSPPGSSTYSSNTLYVGDGTWDSSRNTFLLPNLQGLNFETMRYNGMGNRFKEMDRYHYLIRAHAIIAVIAFLILLPISIMLARFYAKIPGRGARMHIYINILVLGLSTAAFILGFMAVGPSRSLTNPHHGIGVAIYVLVLVQTIFGNWMRKRWKKQGGRRRPGVFVMLHQWIGRSTGLLGVINVPLGLTLYGSPKWTFILYALWITFLLLMYFIQQHKVYKHMDDREFHHRDERSDVIIEEKKKGGLGKFLGPLAAGAGAVFLAKKLGHRDDRSDHSDETSLTDRGGRDGDRRHHRNDSYSSVTVEEKRDKKKNGMMTNLLSGAAVAAAGIFASKYLGGKKKERDEEYSVVGHDSPRRNDRHRPPQPAYSDYTESSVVEEVRRDHPPRGAILPAAAGAAIGAAAAGGLGRNRSRSRSRSHTRHERPRTPPMSKAPGGRLDRRDSYSSYTETVSPSARIEKSNKGRNAIIGGLGLGWLGRKLSQRKDDREQRRLDEIRMREEEDRRRATNTKYGGRPGVGPRRNTYDSMTESDLTSDYTSVHPGPRRAETMPPGGHMPPLNAGSRLTDISSAGPIHMPANPPRDTYQEHLDDSYLSRRRNSRERRDAEAAAATAGAALAAAEAERRRHSRSNSRYRSESRGPREGERMAAAVKVRVGDQDVTVQRLTKDQQVERERRRRRGSLSDSELSSNPRYRRDDSGRRDESASGLASSRRDQRRADRAAEAEIRHMEASDATMPLEPPNPKFARGRVKDSGYYSNLGTPGAAPPGKLGGGGVGLMSGESLGPSESHGTWSAASPAPRTEEQDALRRERAARRRAERSRIGGESVDYN